MIWAFCSGSVLKDLWIYESIKHTKTNVSAVSNVYMCEHMKFLLTLYVWTKNLLNHQIFSSTKPFYFFFSLFIWLIFWVCTAKHFILFHITAEKTTAFIIRTLIHNESFVRRKKKILEKTKLTEKAFKNTKHWIMPSMVSPVRQNVPLKCLPLRPKTVDNDACTIARRWLLNWDVVASAFEELVNAFKRLSHIKRSKDSIVIIIIIPKIKFVRCYILRDLVKMFIILNSTFIMLILIIYIMEQ